MTAINWVMGEVIEMCGELSRIRSRSKTGGVNIENLRDHSIQCLSDTELAAMWDRGDISRRHDPDGAMTDRHRNVLEAPYATLPDAAQAAAEFRLPYIKAFEERRLRYRSARFLGPLIAEVSEAEGHEHRPSVRQLQRWLKAWDEIGCPDLRDVRCIASRTHLRGNSKDRFAPEVDELTWDVIERLALKPEREGAQEIKDEIDRLVDNIDTTGVEARFFVRVIDADGKRRRELNRPSKRTIYRLLKSIDTDVVVRSQRGAVEAERTCDPVVKGPQPTRPLEQVEIDSTVLDVIVLDTTRNIPLGRPWLTVVIDRYTRAVLGILVTFHPPSAHTLMRCLRNAIKPKDDLLATHPNIRGKWPCFGKPKAIVVDNGMEYHSRSLTDACKQLNIDIIYCPVRKPRYKGRIERWFGRLSRQMLHKIPGTTFSNTAKRGDYESEKKAIMSLADLKASILKWIVDDYMPSIHRGINDAPLRKWEEAVKRHPVSLPARADELDVLLSNVEERALTRKGIELHGLLYSMKTPEFRKLINRADKPARVAVKVDYENLASVKVEDWRTGKYIEVTSVDPDYTSGLSMAEHLLLVARVKTGLKKYERVTVKALAATRHEFRQTIQRLKREKKLGGKRFRAVTEDEFLGTADEDGGEFAEHLEPQAAPAAEANPPRATRGKKHQAPQVEAEPPCAEPDDAPRAFDDEEDDIAALMQRTKDSGIAAHAIR